MIPFSNAVQFTTLTQIATSSLIDWKANHVVTFDENGTTLDLNCIAVGFMLRFKSSFTFTNSTKEVVPVSCYQEMSNNLLFK